MTDKKISELTTMTGAQVADGDKFAIDDVSATTTKAITRTEVASALGLGKYVSVGYGGNPTWIDPAATDWADVVANGYGWVQFSYLVTKDVVVTVGTGDGTQQVATQTGPSGNFAFATDGSGSVEYVSNGTRSAVEVTATTAQNAAMLKLGGFFEVAPDGSVGGVAPTLGGAIRWDGSAWVASAT